MKQIRILIVDDHQVVRIGLKTFLSTQPDFSVVGEAGTAEEAVEKTIALQPHVVLMDVRMPGTSGIEGCRAIMDIAPQTNVLMVTSYSDEESILASILAGAKGYVLKQVDTESLVTDIRQVILGKSLLDPQVTQKVFEQLRRMSELVKEKGGDKPVKIRTLTEQEYKILGLIKEGLSNKEIASQLFISPKTVRNYVTNILSKLGLSNRTQAAVYVTSLENEPELV